MYTTLSRQKINKTSKIAKLNLICKSGIYKVRGMQFLITSINTETIILENNIKKAIKQLKNMKAADLNGVAAKHF